MTAILIDGKSIASDITKEIAAEVKSLGYRPGLVVVRVGDDSASEIYVRRKIAACEECGIASAHMPVRSSSTDTTQLLRMIQHLNDSPIHGILVQLPLPEHIDKFKVLNAIDPNKDVDCFTNHNIGLLAQNLAVLKPCTPSGIMELLQRYNIDVVGKHVVIINHSLVVGQPLALMMLAKGATVSVCHSQTVDLPSHTRRGDIVVTAVGRRPHFCLTKDMIKPGAAVIDVGINRLVSLRVKGDAEDDVREVAGYVSPVPNGVGPLTVCMLMKNTLTAAKLSGS